MYIKPINAILCCVLCFLTGMAVMLCYQQTQNDDTEPITPVVNVYVTINNPKDDTQEDPPEDDIESQNESKTPIVESKFWCYDDAVMLAKMAYGESMNVPILESSYGSRSNAYQNACTMWTVLNRVDAGWGTIQGVITAKNQFVGYKDSNPVDSDLLDLAFNILGDWSVDADKLRTLPREYLYFRGDGKHNYFRTQEGIKYDWSLSDPFI